jgi:hypothetical protein
MRKDMNIGETQREFTFMVGLLIQRAYDTGYELTFGDAFAKDGHCYGSLHYIRLAIDLNLFKDGFYLTDSEDHKELGEFWESIGGKWGGRFKDKDGNPAPDGNHYSSGWQGRA